MKADYLKSRSVDEQGSCPLKSGSEFNLQMMLVDYHVDICSLYYLCLDSKSLWKVN